MLEPHDPASQPSRLEALARRSSAATRTHGCQGPRTGSCSSRGNNNIDWLSAYQRHLSRKEARLARVDDSSSWFPARCEHSATSAANLSELFRQPSLSGSAPCPARLVSIWPRFVRRCPTRLDLAFRATGRARRSPPAVFECRDGLERCDHCRPRDRHEPAAMSVGFFPLHREQRACTAPGNTHSGVMVASALGLGRQHPYLAAHRTSIVGMTSNYITLAQLVFYGRRHGHDHQDRRHYLEEFRLSRGCGCNGHHDRLRWATKR